jgi:membrane-associated phospholipid phosphatase
LLVLIRSFFISLTHLGIPADAILPSGPHLWSMIIFKNDLFFSGHTALPFLGFLIFRKEKIRAFFLVMTVILAATVLLMHVHYSIDVFAAFFIAYGSYKFGNIIFKKIDRN